MSSLLVCDVPSSLPEESLYELFMEFGSCSCERINKDAVITYSITSEAKQAYFSLNGYLGIKVIPQFYVGNYTQKTIQKLNDVIPKETEQEKNYSKPMKFCYARRQGEKNN